MCRGASDCCSYRIELIICDAILPFQTHKALQGMHIPFNVRSQHAYITITVQQSSVQACRKTVPTHDYCTTGLHQPSPKTARYDPHQRHVTCPHPGPHTKPPGPTYHQVTVLVWG